MVRRERGSILILVLILLGLGSASISPSLNLVSTALRSKQVLTNAFVAGVTQRAGAEYGVWQILYGSAGSQLTQGGSTSTYTLSLNGLATEVTLLQRATLNTGPYWFSLAENNRIRVTMTVVCDMDGDGFDDDCLSLPMQDGMVARYTVYLDQVSPDTSAGVVAIYNELPKDFDLVPGSVASLDGSLPQIALVTPVNIRNETDEIWKWDFSGSPIYFQQGDVKRFSFRALIKRAPDRYCNGVFLKLSSLPNEQSGKGADVVVGNNQKTGCDKSGVELTKYVDKTLARPNATTILTYVINISSLEDGSTRHVPRIKDVLPPGFIFCSPNFPPGDPQLACDAPMLKIVDDPFVPGVTAFTDVSGFTPLSDPQKSYLPSLGRWALVWDGPGGSGWGLASAGHPGDTLILRFQALVPPTGTGTYYNEAFVDVDCSPPTPLLDEAVTTVGDYCGSYTWPTSGVIVPSYDIVSSVGGGSISAHVELEAMPNGAQLVSWHIN